MNLSSNDKGGLGDLKQLQLWDKTQRKSTFGMSFVDIINNVKLSGKEFPSSLQFFDSSLAHLGCGSRFLGVSVMLHATLHS